MMMPVDLLAAAALLAPGALTAMRLPRSSPRWGLAVALAAVIPVAGPLLALVALRTRGTNQIERDLELEPGPVAPTDPRDIERIGGLPPLLDRLMSADPVVRLCALETIRRRPNRDMIDMLRWAISHGASDTVLDAALTLEEIEINWRTNLDAAVGELGAAPRYTTALRVADLAIEGIANGLVDDAVVDDLAASARQSYQRAAELDPARATEVSARRARLELVAGEPTAALDLLESLRSSCRTWSDELCSLRDRARFAVRHTPSRQLHPTVFALP